MSCAAYLGLVGAGGRAAGAAPPHRAGLAGAPPGRRGRDAGALAPGRRGAPQPRPLIAAAHVSTSAATPSATEISAAPQRSERSDSQRCSCPPSSTAGMLVAIIASVVPATTGSHTA